MHHKNGIPSNGLPFHVVTSAEAIPHVKRIRLSFAYPVTTDLRSINPKTGAHTSEGTHTIEAEVVLDEFTWSGLSFRKQIVTQDGGTQGVAGARTTWNSTRTVLVTGSLSSDGLTLSSFRYVMTEAREDRYESKDPELPNTDERALTQVVFIVSNVRTNSIGFSVGARAAVTYKAETERSDGSSHKETLKAPDPDPGKKRFFGLEF